MRSPFLLSLGLVLLIGGAIGACAHATDGFERDEGSDGSTSGNTASSSSSSSSGAGGNGGASSSAGGAGGASSSSSSSSSSSAGCPDMPCKLVDPQCGCDDPAKPQCSILGKMPACVAGGSVTVGQACGAGNDCGPGLLCVTPAGASVSLCERFCDDDSQCQAPGGLCLLTLNDGMGGSIPGVTLCTENCDPASAATCPVAGTGCQLGQEQAGQMRFFTICAAAGAMGQNATCMGNADCAPSFGCFDTGAPNKVCLKYCKVNAPSCPVGAQCVPIQINMVDIFIGNDQYGACL